MAQSTDGAGDLASVVQAALQPLLHRMDQTESAISPAATAPVAAPAVIVSSTPVCVPSTVTVTAKLD